jgi:hypothetical protein
MRKLTSTGPGSDALATVCLTSAFQAESPPWATTMVPVTWAARLIGVRRTARTGSRMLQWGIELSLLRKAIR